MIESEGKCGACGKPVVMVHLVGKDAICDPPFYDVVLKMGAYSSARLLHKCLFADVVLHTEDKRAGKGTKEGPGL